MPAFRRWRRGGGLSCGRERGGRYQGQEQVSGTRTGEHDEVPGSDEAGAVLIEIELFGRSAAEGLVRRADADIGVTMAANGTYPARAV
jgi:hypothetical protein